MGKANSKAKTPRDPSAVDLHAGNQKHGAVDTSLIKKLQAETHFDTNELKKVFEVFNSFAIDAKLDRASFTLALAKLDESGFKGLTGTPFAHRLFEMLDSNRDNTVDTTEFASGLSLLCKGTIEEKLELSFRAYDYDGNGFITKEELRTMFIHAWMYGFKALTAVDEAEELSAEDLQEFSEEMATLFADNTFQALDTQGAGQLSLDNFKQFALAEPKITATLNGTKKEVVLAFA
eukprot:TRINITY_DN11877_c0_g1_i1.p1 TRINITY_DN11877_c0_g1~~TRINITY_DN11877_c0_g1_i1.p1  ORF type:complete len:234 (-),score=57.43 TRINITY_DN11877_c0_g1_i1:9-710(-)